MIFCLLLYDRLFITVIILLEDRRQCIFSRHLVFLYPPLREHYPDTKRIAVKRSISFKREMSMARIDRSTYQNTSSHTQVKVKTLKWEFSLTQRTPSVILRKRKADESLRAFPFSKRKALCTGICRYPPSYGNTSYPQAVCGGLFSGPRTACG